MNSTEEIIAGDWVRSFDFAENLPNNRHRSYGRDLEGDGAYYVEGVIEEVGVQETLPDAEGRRGKFKFECPRYRIRCTRRVFGGKDRYEDVGQRFYPPVNGTGTILGGECDGVERINRKEADNA